MNHDTITIMLRWNDSWNRKLWLFWAVGNWLRMIGHAAHLDTPRFASLWSGMGRNSLTDASISLFAVSILIPDSARFYNFCRKLNTLWGKFYKLTQVYFCTLMRLKFKSINLMMSDGIWQMIFLKQLIFVSRQAICNFLMTSMDVYRYILSFECTKQ